MFLLWQTNIFAQEIECFPSEIETLMLEHLNSIRAQPTKETLLQRFGLKKNTELGRVPPFHQEIFEEELSKISTLDPVFYDPDLTIVSRKHSQYIITNGQSHTQESNKEYFTGFRFPDRLKSMKCQLVGLGENCYQKSYGPEHCMLAFLIDWGEGHGNMQTGRPHRQNIFNKRAVLAGNGCVPFDNFVSVTQVFSAGESNCNYFGGVVYTDLNNNGLFDIGEGHGNIQIDCSDGEGSTLSYPSGLYVLKTPKKQVEEIRFSFGSFHRLVKITNQNGLQKIDLKLSLAEEEQIYKGLEELKTSQKLTEIDFNWMCLHFRFKNTKLLKERSEVFKPLQEIERAIFKELMNEPVEKLNILISNSFKTYAGDNFHSWLKGIAYVASKKAQFQSLKGNSNINKWQEYKLGVNSNQYPYPEVNYYLGKLIDNADFEINNLKAQK